MAVAVAPRRLMEPGCEFKETQRPGTVLQCNTNGYFVIWDEWTDPKDGVVHEKCHDLLPYERISEANRYGFLEIIRRPNQNIMTVGDIRRECRSHKEKERMLARKACVLAAVELEQEGHIGSTRIELERNAQLVIDRARSIHTRLAKDLAAISKPRRGERAIYGSQSASQTFVFDLSFISEDDPKKCAASFYKWRKEFRQTMLRGQNGEEALFDTYRECGGKSGHKVEFADFVAGVIDPLYDMERRGLKSMHESVKAAIKNENEQRRRQDPPQKTLPENVSPAYVRKQMDRIGYARGIIRSKGFDEAYRDAHGIGMGITTDRALQRVEIDEYTIDVTLLMKLTGAWDQWTPQELKDMGLDGSRKRVTISAAIDVHTRCILALLIVPEGTKNILRQTLEMIFTNKKTLSDAMGCKYAWAQYGAPEEIVVDRGSKYISDEAYAVLASMGITNVGAPAGKPWLKPFIERLFKTMHCTFLQRLPARNFSNVVERGANDPQARACLNLDEFLVWMTRWIVDYYHNRDHPGLGMTPLQAWERSLPVRDDLTTKEMRAAFGTSLTRKLGRHGITIMDVDYQTEALYNIFTSKGPVEMEIRLWEGDIGTIDVLVDGTEWKTVSATDPYWIGKTMDDVRAVLAERRKLDPDAEAARLNFVFDVDQRITHLKAVAGLVARPRTAQGVELTEAHFARYMDTAERRALQEPYVDLLGTEVLPDEETVVTPSTALPALPAPDPDLPEDDDLME